MDSGKDDNILGFQCPRANCPGVLEDYNSYKCSECGLVVDDRNDYWEKVKLYGREICSNAFERVIKMQREGNS